MSKNTEHIDHQLPGDPIDPNAKLRGALNVTPDIRVDRQKAVLLNKNDHLQQDYFRAEGRTVSSNESDILAGGKAEAASIRRDTEARRLAGEEVRRAQEEAALQTRFEQELKPGDEMAVDPLAEVSDPNIDSINHGHDAALASSNQALQEGNFRLDTQYNQVTTNTRSELADLWSNTTNDPYASVA